MVYPEVEQLLMETLGWESLMAQMFRHQQQLVLIDNFDTAKEEEWQTLLAECVELF